MTTQERDTQHTDSDTIYGSEENSTGKKAKFKWRSRIEERQVQDRPTEECEW